MDETIYSYDLPQNRVLKESASFIRRVGAFLIDLLAYLILLHPQFIRAFQLSSGLSGALLTIDYLRLNPWLTSVLLGVLVSGSVVFCFYLTVSEYVFGKTIGQHFLGLELRGKTSIWGLVARNLLKSTFIILLPFDLLGLLFFKQRFIDKLLGVNVLYEDKLNLSSGYL